MRRSVCAHPSTLRSLPASALRRQAASKSGVALIVALGLLALLALFAMTFSALTSSRRGSSALLRDGLRARELIPAALGRALEAIASEMRASFSVYPLWDYLVSTGDGGICAGLINSATRAHIPFRLRDAVEKAEGACAWVSLDTDAYPGRPQVAYIVFNMSGFLDANEIHRTNRVHHVFPGEVQAHPLVVEIENVEVWLKDRQRHVRYEDVAELALNDGFRAVSDGFSPAENLATYSFDPNPNVRLVDTSSLGTDGVALTNRMNINALTDAHGWIEAERQPFVGVLAGAGLANPVAAFWNLVNYLDADRLPRGERLDAPWLSVGVSEAHPLVNEVVIQSLPDLPGVSNRYEAVVELWHPFAPEAVAADAFRIELLVAAVANVGVGAAGASLSTATQPLAFLGAPIPNMSYDDRPFHTFATEFVIPVNGTNMPLSETHSVWALARVVETSGNAPVHQGPGAEPARFTEPGALEIDDPRFAADFASWQRASPHSLGAINSACTAFGPGNQGLPIYLPNRPMRSVAELGHVFAGDAPWRAIAITNPERGAALLDLFTARAGADPVRGLVAAGTDSEAVWQALLTGIETGWPPAAPRGSLAALAAVLADAGPFNDLRSLFDTGDSRVADALLEAATGTPVPERVSTLDRYGLLQGFTELISFRHNLFLIALAARTVAADGTTPTAEARALALVWRDAYTGRFYTRWLRPLYPE